MSHFSQLSFLKRCRYLSFYPITVIIIRYSSIVKLEQYDVNFLHGDIYSPFYARYLQCWRQVIIQGAQLRKRTSRQI
jgi:hypothetical protein